MTFALQVGEVAKSTIEFSFHQLLGRTVIRANGREVKRQVRLFSEPVLDMHEFEVEEAEKVRVKIEKRRNLLVSSYYLVYVNNHLVQRFQGI